MDAIRTEHYLENMIAVYFDPDKISTDEARKWFKDTSWVKDLSVESPAITRFILLPEPMSLQKISKSELIGYKQMIDNILEERM